MSNKTLILIIIAIVVVCGGAAGLFYWQQTRPLVVTDEDIKKAQEEALKNQTQQPPESIPMAQNDCQRAFDENKLKTDKVAISGRQVEIDVKDFGKITVEFYDKDAPKTVENFLRLTNSGYYSCLTFHRVAKGFVIQGGDPNGDGSGGISAFGEKFADEINRNASIYKLANGTPGYKKGTLAMANSGPNTNGSQFFIMLDDIPTSAQGFDALYTIFGKVTAGLDVVDKIAGVDINPGQFGPTDGSPKQPVVMQSVKIIK